VITEDHKKTILDAIKQQYNTPDVLGESVVFPPSGGKWLSRHVVTPDVAAYALGGAAFGSLADLGYHAVTNSWKWIKDLLDGQTVDKKEVEAYARKVKKHADERLKIMIGDLKKAIQKEDWIKVNRIQREIRNYGKKLGYMKEEQNLQEISKNTLAKYILTARSENAATDQVGTHLVRMGLRPPKGMAMKRIRREMGVEVANYKLKKKMMKVNEDGGAGGLGGGAPTNNVGGGHIAGAAGDPPGGKNKMRRRLLRRKMCEALDQGRGTYSMVGYSFNKFKPTAHYLSINRNGKYLHTTSKSLAKRHARAKLGRK
jgi:hypothetical protein